ncbi:MAG: hypothetical protein V9E89_03630 [Ilumatobacteraceae bacterium]
MYSAQRFQARARLFGQAIVRRVEEVGVGLLRAAPDPPAQLVQLRQAEQIGAVDDQRVGVGDIQPALDDRRRQQNVVLAVGELLPSRAASSCSSIWPCPMTIARFRHNLLQPFAQRVDGLHAVVHDEHLPAALHLAQHRLAHQPFVERRRRA